MGISSTVSISRFFFARRILSTCPSIPFNLVMRLLNATTLLIETVLPGKEPPYAILSHRWTDDEVLLNDIQNGTARHKASFAKLKGCCDVALGQGLSHIWIDTCCIDQTSSAELSEAINSMFSWYRGARVCYAYLFDANGAHDFLVSQWFDRGWTLQELVAPKEVQFYAGDWTQFGDRRFLSFSISQVTGIAEEYLHGGNIWGACIAERMSWAARRKTTKPEDIAYCMLGIFNIHMPLLYGEGSENAFIRLQREIIGGLKSPDDSWLAWGTQPGKDAASMETEPAQVQLGGVLARSPSLFRNCRDVVLAQRGAATAISWVDITNANIQINLPIVRVNDRDHLLLGCRPRSDYWSVMAIPVSRLSGRYYRTSSRTINVKEELWSDDGGSGRSVGGINLSPDPYTATAADKKAGDLFYAVQLLMKGFRVFEVFPPAAWEPRDHIRIHLGIQDRYQEGPRRVVRLERHSTPDGSSDPHHYLLDLNFKRVCRKHQEEPVVGPYCRVGVVPRDSPPLREDLADVQFNRAVIVSGTPEALTAEVTYRKLYTEYAYVVDVYMGDEDAIRGTKRAIEDEPEWTEAPTPTLSRDPAARWKAAMLIALCITGMLLGCLVFVLLFGFVIFALIRETLLLAGDSVVLRILLMGVWFLGFLILIMVLGHYGVLRPKRGRPRRTYGTFA